MTKIRLPLFLTTLFVVLAISMMRTSPAFADDSAPPPQTEESAELPPADGDSTPAPTEEPQVAPTDADAQETPAPTEEPQIAPTDADAQEPPAPTEEPQIAPTDTDAQEPPASLLEQTPEDTQVVVLDTSGETVPLATNQAADAIANGDPQWCPNGVKPGSSTCSDAFTSFQLLLDWLAAQNSGAGPNKSGTIWIESTYKSNVNDPSATEFTLDGLALTSMANFALTIQGGWTGTKKNINPSAPSEFNVSLSILNWNNTVTVKNIIFTGLTDGGNHSAALYVESMGNITLVDVDAKDNNQDINGAYLNNQNAPDNKPGGVVVTNSEFTNNKAYGLKVESKGAITINGLIANGNTTGAHLDNSFAVSAQPVTIKGNNNQAKYNSESGLFILSHGAVTINSLIASKNTGWGAYIENKYEVSPSLFLASPVTLTGTNVFEENGNDGIYIISSGAVSINNVSANNNGNQYDNNNVGVGPKGYNGVQIDNSDASSPQPITISGVSSFNNNQWNGLYILGSGAVTISDFVADHNGVYNYIVADDPSSDPSDFDAESGFGIKINNTFGDGKITLGANHAGWCNSTSSNFQSGLDVEANGAVVLYNLCSSNNGGYVGSNLSFSDMVGGEAYGAYIINTANTAAPVTLAGVNEFNNNFNDGLFVESNGVIKVANLNANQNNGGGAILNNLGSVKRAAISFSGYVYTNDNDGGHGLDVKSKGAITIKVNDAGGSNNSGSGWVLDNHDVGSKGNIVLTAPAAAQDRAFSFSSNLGDGIRVDGLGSISITGLDANNNQNNGAYLKNNYPGSQGAVTVTAPAYGSNSFNHNDGGNGLFIQSFGAISVGKIEANENLGYGAKLDNGTDAPAPQNIALSGFGVFNHNGVSGLDIRSKGSVVTANLTANENQNGWGIHIDNYSEVTNPALVTLNGWNRASGNHLDGIFVDSLGNILVKDITANNNQGAGARLNNQYDKANGSVRIISSTAFARNSFVGNHAGGLWVVSNRAVTLSNLVATGNQGGDGVYVNTADHYGQYKANWQKVTISGVNNISDNSDYGLVVSADGSIVVANLNANRNGRDGAYLNNSKNEDNNRDLHGNVTISGINSFNDNAGAGNNGLNIVTNGAAALTNITADGNSEDGVHVEAKGAIAITCGSMNNNNNHGWSLTSSTAKQITLKGVVVYGNTGGNKYWNGPVNPVETRGC